LSIKDILCSTVALFLEKVQQNNLNWRTCTSFYFLFITNIKNQQTFL